MWKKRNKQGSREAVFFARPESLEPGSKVNHYEGAPPDLPFPTDGTPIWIDHPMFSYDDAMRNLPMVIALAHWPYVDTVARHAAAGDPMGEKSVKMVETKTAWLSGEIPIPPDEWESILELRRTVLRRSDYPEDHPFGAPYESFAKKEGEERTARREAMTPAEWEEEVRPFREQQEKLAQVKLPHKLVRQFAEMQTMIDRKEEKRKREAGEEQEQPEYG